jgi:hypothetical protein
VVNNGASILSLSVSGDSILNSVVADDITAGNLNVSGILTVASVDADILSIDGINATSFTTVNLEAEDVHFSNLEVDYLIKGKIESSEESDHTLEADLATVAEKVSNKLIPEDYLISVDSLNNSVSFYDGSSEVKVSVNATVNVEPNTIVARNDSGDINGYVINGENIYAKGEQVVTLNPGTNKIRDTDLPNNIHIYEEDGVFNVPEGISVINVMAIGGGGAGGVGTSFSGGGGGGAGAIINKSIKITASVQKIIYVDVAGMGQSVIDGMTIDGENTYLFNNMVYVKPGIYDDNITVDSLPEDGIDNILYLKKGIINEEDSSFWSWNTTNVIWDNIILDRFIYLDKTPKYPLNGSYYYIGDSLLRCIYEWVLYDVPNTITVDMLPISNIEEESVYILTYANNTKWILDYYDEYNNPMYKEYTDPIITDSPTLPTDPNNINIGDVIRLTSDDGNFVSGDVVIYKHVFNEISDEEYNLLDLINIADYKNPLLCAYGGKGGVSGDGDILDNHKYAGDGGLPGLMKTSGAGGNGYSISDGGIGGSSILEKEVLGGLSHIDYTENIVNELPSLNDALYNINYTLDQDDGDRLSGSSWIKVNNFWKRICIGVDDINAPDSDYVIDNIIDDNFDFYKIYRLSDGKNYKFYLNTYRNPITPDLLPENDKIYIQQFDYLYNLDRTKHYVFVNDYIHPIEGYFIRRNAYDISIDCDEVFAESDFSGGGGSGGSAFGLGGIGGTGGSSYYTSGKQSNSNSFGAGGGGGGRNPDVIIGGNGSPGLVTISY